MKAIAYSVLAGLVFAGALAATPASARVCLNTRDIVTSNSKDGKILDFTMRDGTLYRNHLQGVCTDLKYEGFVWTIHGIEEVCENMQSLRVINSGQVCVLGKFDAPVPKAPKPM